MLSLAGLETGPFFKFKSQKAKFKNALRKPGAVFEFCILTFEFASPGITSGSRKMITFAALSPG